MRISEYLDKDNLHHAYLLEGARDEIVPEILEFMTELGVVTSGNPDFLEITLDSLKVEDAKNLKTFQLTKGISQGKKIFIISTNNFLLEAQNVLLKMFEEPVSDTHFFLIVPDMNALLPTLLSRVYKISGNSKSGDSKEAEAFIAMTSTKRIEFLKSFLTLGEDEESGAGESTRARALKFINALESALHSRLMSKTVFDTEIFKQIFTVREFLRQPGSSTKTLLESLALTIPEKI